MTERWDEYRDCAVRVAHEILGKPNRHLSNGKELRWGSQGSMALDIERGVFFDHEQNDGGGVRWLLRHKLGLDQASIAAWLLDRQYIRVDERPKKGRRKIVATYDYSDEAGAVLFQVVRFEPKDFRQRKPNCSGWSWSVKGVPQVPYRLPALTEASANGRPVFIVEGEKDCDRLAQWNVPATCNAGGAGKWRDELTEHLRDADVILIPDNDDAGYHHLNVVGAALTGVAKRIRVLMLPGLPAKGDASDWIAAGGTVEQFWELVEAAPDWVARAAAAERHHKAKAKAKAKAEAAAAEQKLVEDLARLEGLEYARRRRDAARELGVNVGPLDREVQARREAIAAKRGPPPLFGHWVVQPWPEPVDGNTLLLAIMQRIRRHVVLTNDQTIGVALWILQAWAHEGAATHSPILLATSAEANSGKTTLINLVGFLVPRGLPCVGISEAALYRSLERLDPCLILDEADTILIENEPLRAVINSGWTRGQGVLRCVGDSHEPELFPTFCPKVVGMKGKKLPDTTLGRCIIIEMKRKRQSESAENFKHTDDAGLGELRRRALRWRNDNVEALKDAAPELPPGFANRLGDNWWLLLAIADFAGWGEKARHAASVLSKVVADGVSIGTRLLADIRTIFSERNTDRLSSEDVVDALAKIEGAPWAEWKGGKPLTKNGLGRLLAPFGIASGSIRTGPTTTPKGYQLGHFGDAFDRYLGESGS